VISEHFAIVVSIAISRILVLIGIASFALGTNLALFGSSHSFSNTHFVGVIILFIR